MALRCTPKNIYVSKNTYEGQLPSSGLAHRKFMVSLFFLQSPGKNIFEVPNFLETWFNWQAA